MTPTKDKPVKTSIPREEGLRSGHLACQGCGAMLAMRYAQKGLGRKTVFVTPACCWTILAGPAPKLAIETPIIHCPFATAAATASGVKAGLIERGDTETQVCVWAGDGGTYDIGLQALSGAADRNEDIIYVCYDNEAYMNTGIQRSGGTPAMAWTMTTQGGSRRPKKDLDKIMEAHSIPYQATVTPGFPEDMVKKFQKVRGIKGFRFIRVLSPCPPGWKHDSADTVALSKLAVQTGAFPLYEIENGVFKLNMKVAKRKPIADYLKRQGRFRKLKDENIQAMQASVDAAWENFTNRK
ncbi:MAG: thiamine pyrophosphate-dependent enzyme [Elusimicrobiota bacterium]